MTPKVKQLVTYAATTVGALAAAICFSPIWIRAGIITVSVLTLDFWIVGAVLFGKEPKVFGKRIVGVSFLLAIIFSEVSPLLLQSIKAILVLSGVSLGSTQVWWFSELALSLFVAGTVVNVVAYVWSAYESKHMSNLSVSQFSDDGQLGVEDGDHSLDNPLLLILRRTLLLPFRWPHHYNLHVVKNICYATQEEVDEAGPVHAQDLRLDIYRNKNAITPLGTLNESSYRDEGGSPKLRPVLVYVHGGAWKKNLGSKENLVVQPLYMAEMGWVTVSIDYRLLPDHHWPTFIVDCKRALRWVKQNIQNYGGDPDFIVLGGGSAGGHLASLLAISGPKSHTSVVNRHCREWQPGFDDLDLSVQGCITWYPACDTSGEWFTSVTQKEYDETYHKQASPQHLLENMIDMGTKFLAETKLCPFYVITGSADVLCPKDYMSKFYRTLKFVSAQSKHHAKLVEYLELPGAHHAFDQLNSPRTIYSNAAATRFCRQVYQDWQRENDDSAKSGSESDQDSCSTNCSSSNTSLHGIHPAGSKNLVLNGKPQSKLQDALNVMTAKGVVKVNSDLNMPHNSTSTNGINEESEDLLSENQSTVYGAFAVALSFTVLHLLTAK